jgi:DNA-binding response OmpR family regulator
MGQRHVLVIDDDVEIHELVRHALAGAGYTVTGIDSMLGALALAERLQPVAILLDLGLPYKSGVTLLTEIRKHPQIANVPIVVISGLADDLPPDRRALAHAVLPKPFGLSALLAAVNSAAASGHAQDSRRAGGSETAGE